MRFALVLAVVAGCQNRHEPVQPVTAAEAQAFAAAFATAMYPCDETRLAALLDGDAMAERVRAHSRKMSATTVRDAKRTAHNLCVGGASTEGYRLLHMKTVDGQPHPVMRRLARSARKHVVTAGYDELLLTRSADGQVRAADLYPYAQGAWLTDTIALGVEAMTSDGPIGGAVEAGMLHEARELQHEGKSAEALAKVDLLPAETRRTRMVQTMRIVLATRISEDAYKQALDELARLYPDDPTFALFQIDGAFLRGDLDGALHNVDLLDQAVGGDPFQDAVRAEVYAKRGKPGDLELAAARAEAAITAEPTLAKGWWARLDIAVRAKNYPLAIETMDHLRQAFGAKLDEDALRTLPGYADLFDSPEYKSRGG